jgi:phage/plasmid-associated DNA primase
VVVIQFPPIEETKQDENIKRQIKLSGQAIFNWALEGLDRLQARGHFVKPAESAHVLKLVPKDHEISVFD